MGVNEGDLQVDVILKKILCRLQIQSHYMAFKEKSERA